ncbi:hypothetical protein ACOIWS_002731 [Salmonella enterica]
MKKINTETAVYSVSEKGGKDGLAPDDCHIDDAVEAMITPGTDTFLVPQSPLRLCRRFSGSRTMSRQKEKIVMMDSDEAASIRTLTGWVDRQGRFWGNDEYQARWCGATHRKCKNKPEEHPIHSTHGYCEECHRESRQAKFAEMERAVWAGEPLVIFDGDQYFFNAESLVEYCRENSVFPNELQLLICEPNYPPEFDIEQHCEEIIPDGGDCYSLPQAVLDAADALNKAIKESSPVSWSGSDRVAIVSDDMLTDEQKAEIMAERTA